MFGGIIEEIGIIKSIKNAYNKLQFTIAADIVLKNVKLGDSIAVNGVCLTVSAFEGGHFTVDIMPETVKATSFAVLKSGVRVNLERALAIGNRLGGHFVTGHVDGVGEIIQIKKANNALYYQIRIDAKFLNYCMLRGSIAIDGTSLTIFELGSSYIKISLIPHTLKHSVLGEKNVGDIVNIECDMLGKYVAQMLQQRSAYANINETQKVSLKTESEILSSLNWEFLNQHGF